MKTLLSAALLAFAVASAFGAPKDVILSPVTVVSENVNVSVGPKMALVVGRYWYQYVPKLDDHTPRVAIQYAAFVPQGVTTYTELLEVSQVKLMLGDREFRPESARVLEVEEISGMQAMPEDAAVAWFTFQIPRELARLRFDVVISHFQPHYHYEKKLVAAYLPWLPNLERFRTEMELRPAEFTVTVEALPKTTFELLSVVTDVGNRSDKRMIVHPLHLENIAVAVTVTE
jgi:hypothetical protein